jgi:hypothetical protein
MPGGFRVLSKLVSKLTYANVMATVAVFAALGGGAYAAIKLPANSVGSKQIKKKAVTPAKVAPATVRLFKGQRGAKGDTGAQGDTGAKGDTGATGPQGASAASLISAFARPNENTSLGVSYFEPFGRTFFDSNMFTEMAHVAPQAFAARDLYVKLTSPPGAGAARSFTLVVDDSSTALGCTVAHPATSCENGVAAVTVPKGSLYALKMENSATAPAEANFITWAFRATSP